MTSNSGDYFHRNATPSDSEAACDLIAQAYGNYLYKICGTENLSLAKERLAFFFTHSKVSLIHHSHCSLLIHRESGQIAGAMSTVRGDFVPAYFLALAELLGLLWEKDPKDSQLLESIQECVGPIFVTPKEFHVDALAIAPEFRARGLSRELFDRALLMAKEHQLPEMTLLCREKLGPYYTKLGFENRGELIFDAGETYLRFFMPVV